jgi:hypothetical protein
MVLDLFRKINDLPDEKLHPKFLLLRDEPTLSSEKQIVIDWTNGFTDRDNKIVKEFQTTFHSAFWEFYLFALFKEANLTIDFSKDRPDFIANSPYEINIEAVVSEIKQNGRSESTRNIDDILSMLSPYYLWDGFDDFINEAIVRYSNSISGKLKKFQSGYTKCPWLKNETPFVIALASYAQVNYGREFYYPMMALLYGYYFNPKSNSYSQKTNIIKPGTTSDIPIGIFQNASMQEVSAIIFSCTLSMGKLTSLSKSLNKSTFDMNRVINVRHDFDPPYFKVQIVSPDSPEELTDGIYVFHNPFAKNKLSLDVFAKTNATQVTVDSDGFLFAGSQLPIVSRFNIPKFFLPDKLWKQFLSETFEQLNPDIKMSLFKVVEVDFSVTPKEITLIDQFTELPVIIDFSEKDAELIRANDIKKGDTVSATIKNSIYELGNTAIWQLISIEKSIT